MKIDIKENYPLISVVLATFNEEKNISNCIESIKRQSYPSEKIEIIVVDNNSQDKTIEIAGRYTKQVYNLVDHIKLDNVKNFRGAQINLGVEKARGKIIFFPDSDMTFENNLFENFVEEIISNLYDALYIPEVVCGQGFFGKIRNFERSFYNGACIDAVRVVTKEIFLKVKGFDVFNIVFAPDDWDFTKILKKNNFKLAITKYKLFHHEESVNLKTYLRKKSNYAATFDAYIEKWGKDDPDIKKQFGFGYRYFGVFLENGKWKRFFLHPLLSFGMYFLRFLVGIQFLLRKKNKR